MNIFNHFSDQIKLVIKDLITAGTLPEGLPVDGLTVEPPRDPSHGDISTNVALVLNKQAGMKPRELAELVAEGLRQDENIEIVDIAGPGFINLRLKPSFILSNIPDILSQGIAYGGSDKGQGVPVNVEYVSANPTGPMHVGHCRGAIFGDALASLLEKAGHSVAREYYINDAGAQIDVLARSAYLRYREALGEDIGEIPEGLYPGDYLVHVGETLARTHGKSFLGKPESDWLPAVRRFASDAMMDMIRNDLRALGIVHKVFFSERTLHDDGRIDQALESLREKGLIYTGVLEPPKGKLPDDWEPRPQVLFKATEFGDDVDRALQKSDGSWTYFAADVAYHRDKIGRGFNHMIDVWGADHGGYVKRMKAVVKALSDNQADLDVRLCQLVRLFRNGEPYKMSKRAGTFVTLREVVDEVGKDVLRFIMLTRKNDAPLDFDFAKVMEQSRDNPVFYVQYAHARICSVLRKVAEAFPEMDLSEESLAQADLSKLTDTAEIELIMNMASWPRMVEAAAEAHEPHRIAFYLYELASAFHGLWNKGNDDVTLRFLQEDDQAVTLSRVAMIRACAIVIASGLNVLGVVPVKEMN